MKTDARVRYTKHVIQEAFLQTLKEKPLSKITVKEICDKAEINRGTFYKHYLDIYDLMTQLEQEAIDSFLELLQSIPGNGTSAILLKIINALLQYRDLVQPLLENTSNNDFLKHLTDCCTNYALSQLQPADTDLLSSNQKKCLYAYLAGGTTKVIEHWLESGANESPEEIARTIETLNDAMLALDL